MTDPTAILPAAPAVTTPAGPTLALTEVCRSFADRRVLGPVSLQLDPGVLAVVHGVNGAGKTTLLRVAAGLLTPTGGVRSCAGRAVYLRPGGGARAALTVRQALRHTAALAGGRGVAADAAAGRVGLTGELLDRRVGQLSAGQRARLSAALALIANAALVCLDEPAAHLDGDGVDQVHAALTTLIDRGASVLLASLGPGEFSGLADAVLRVERGIVWEESW